MPSQNTTFRMHLQNCRSAENDAYARKRTTSRVIVTSRPKVCFRADGITSPRNYGWLFIAMNRTNMFIVSLDTAIMVSAVQCVHEFSDVIFKNLASSRICSYDLFTSLYREFQKELCNGSPNVTLWRVLRKCLHFKACKLSVVQHLLLNLYKLSKL
jgi:hypothetical protein